MPRLDLVASLGAWLLENGHRTRAMTARTATAEERAQLWPQITRRFRNYASYQASTDREIPVVVCDPA